MSSTPNQPRLRGSFQTDLKRWAYAAAKDVPEGRLGGLVLQLRLRARQAEARSRIFLVILILAIIGGLFFYLGLPFIERATDTRRETLIQTRTAIDAEAQKLGQQREEVRAALVEALALTSVAVPSGSERYLQDSLLLPDGTILLHGSRGTILLSTDQGQSFTEVPSGTEQDLQDSLLLPDGIILLLGRGGTILRSTDQGQSFTDIPSGTRRDLWGSLLLPDGNILLHGSGGKILRSADQGQSFTNVPGTGRGLPGSLLLPDGTVFLHGHGGTILRSADQGQSFTKIPSGTEQNLLGSLLLPDGTIVLHGRGGTILHSTDHGQSFTELPSGTEQYLQDSLLLPDGIILLHGDDGTILRSTDQGQSFTEIPSGTAQYLRGNLLLPDGTILLHGDDGTILRSSDQGQSFTDIPSGTGQHLRVNLLLPDGTILLLGDGGTILRVSDQLARQVPPLPLHEEGVPQAAEHDDALLKFLKSALPAHIRRQEPIPTLLEQATQTATVQGVLITRKNAVQEDINEIDNATLTTLIGRQQRQEFTDFMAICRARQAYAADPPDPTKADPVTIACAQAWQADRAAASDDLWQSLARQIPPGVLLLFLLATMGGLYRYNLRLAGFHDSRADAIEVLSEGLSAKDLDTFSDLSTALAADKVDFARASTPADQATEIAKAAVSRVSR